MLSRVEIYTIMPANGIQLRYAMSRALSAAWLRHYELLSLPVGLLRWRFRSVLFDFLLPNPTYLYTLPEPFENSTLTRSLARAFDMPRADRASQNAARNAPYALRSEQTNLIRTSPYTSIDSENGETRLLELAPGKFDDTIMMRLIPCNVMADDPDPYEALSYCWGTEMTPRMAVLDGVPMSITANLDCALRHLRFTIVRRTMWVDAISMNQKDTQERNYQVQIMGRIYSAAQRVIVWLGPTDHDNLYLRVVLGAMQFHFSEQSSTTVRLFDYMCGVVDIMNQQAGKDNDSRECVLDALHSIIDRSWFSRIWV
jgi:hypothetical protein